MEAGPKLGAKAGLNFGLPPFSTILCIPFVFSPSLLPHGRRASGSVLDDHRDPHGSANPSNSLPSPPAPKRQAQKQDTREDHVLEALACVEATLSRFEEQAIRAEKRVEELEAAVKSLLRQQQCSVARHSTNRDAESCRRLLSALWTGFLMPGYNCERKG